MSNEVLAAIAGVVGIVAVIGLIVTIIMVIAEWKVFTKADEAGWKALIPIYNQYTMFKIAWNPNMFWVFLGLSVASGFVTGIAGDNGGAIVGLITMVLSIVQMVISIMFLYKLSKAFGYGVGFTIGLIFLSPIFYLILAFGSAEYQGPQD